MGKRIRVVVRLFRRLCVRRPIHTAAMPEENVKVAVRCRPFNSREKERNAKLIISMDGPTTEIRDPSGDKEPKKFTFDYSYWSHDGFVEQDDKVLAKDGPNSKYHGQEEVFNDLGRGVLENAYNGFNTSLFAYGQTGSGKSFSMVSARSARRTTTATPRRYQR